MQSPSDAESGSDPTVNYVTIWEPEGVCARIATSATCWVGLMEDRCTVLKYPHDKTPEAMSRLHEEAAMYQHIGPHENVVLFKGIHEDG